MKKASVVTLSMELYYKSSMTANKEYYNAAFF